MTNRGQQRTSSISGTGTVSLQQPASNRAGSIAASRNDGNAAERVERESFISDVPKWIEVEHLPWKERCEIHLYKLVALVPVSVTFCLYFYLFIYYAVVSGNSDLVSLSKFCGQNSLILFAHGDKSFFAVK